MNKGGINCLEYVLVVGPDYSEMDFSQLQTLLSMIVDKETVVFVVTREMHCTTVEKVMLAPELSKWFSQPVLISEKILFRLPVKDLKILVHSFRLSQRVVFVNSRYNPNLFIGNNQGEEFFNFMAVINGQKPWRMVFYTDLFKSGHKFSLLHEVGHVQSLNQGLSRAERLKSEVFEYYYSVVEHMLSDDRTAEPREDEILFTPDPWTGQGEIYLPVGIDEFLTWHEAAAKEEKRAWKFALEIVGLARRYDLDLEPSLPGHQGLLDYCYADSRGLGAYENALEKCQAGIRDKKILGLYRIK